MQRWTAREDAIAIKLYPNYPALRRRLDRSLSAIRLRCQTLKLTRGSKPWTSMELSRLGRIWPEGTKREIAKAFPDRTSVAIEQQATAHKIRRKRAPLITGTKLVDDVRQRARALGYTMAELDALARSGRYFKHNCQRGIPPNLKFIQRAIIRLEGTLAIKWTEYR